jgi:NADPH2:quinone reductase
MKAAYIEELGGPGKVKIGDVPTPEPRHGQVLLRTRAASLGPWDVKIMSGMFGQIPLPMIPGLEVAGVVERAADGADLRPGDEVHGSLGFAAGACAEYAVANANTLARKPRGMTFEAAAGLVVGAGTAYEGLVDRLKVQAGETVLITAASGGVGTAAVQIAAALGARVIGVASARNHEYMRDLGASETFDYNDTKWVDAIREAVPGGVDVLFDASGGETRDAALNAVRDGGRAAFIVGPPDTIGRGITGEFFSADVTRQRIEAIDRLVQDGKLRVELDATFPLDQARDALEHVAAGHTRGKVVITI